MKSMHLETNIVHVGDNITNLKNITDISVDMCVTSPPYYNLRDYYRFLVNLRLQCVIVDGI